MLAGVIFLVATNTYDEHIGRYFTPPFMVCLFLAIQSMRAYATPESRRRAKVGVGIALILSCLFGVFLYVTLTVNREALTDWANRLINDPRFQMATTGLSEESHLGSMFGQSGSYDRVVSIRGSADVSYMRAMSMYNYDHGFWRPSSGTRDRHYSDVDESQLRTGIPGDTSEVTRYMSMRGIILAPLNTTSLEIEGASRLRWANMEGGPLRANEPVPDHYILHTAGAPDQQGPVLRSAGYVAHAPVANRAERRQSGYSPTGIADYEWNYRSGTKGPRH